MSQEPKEGDMVEFMRYSGTYSHFGIADGKGNVIHTTSDGNPGKSKVMKQSLSDVAGTDKYIVNNQDGVYGPPSLSGSDIVKKAEHHIGEKWPYNPVTKNCETFASQMRHGEKGESMQVADTLARGLGPFQEAFDNFQVNSLHGCPPSTHSPYKE